MELPEMENVKVIVKGTKMMIEVDLEKDLGPSSSGKTVIIGTTRGNQRIKVPFGTGFVFLSLNVYRYPKRGE